MKSVVRLSSNEKEEVVQVAWLFTRVPVPALVQEIKGHQRDPSLSARPCS